MSITTDEIEPAKEMSGRPCIPPPRASDPSARVARSSRIEAEALRARKRGRVDQGAGRIVRAAATAVGAVGVAGERRDARRAGKLARERQGIFLVRSAAALPAQRHGELAARQDDGAPSRALDLARKPRMCGSDLARLALDPVAEEDRLETGGRDHGLHRAKRIGRPRHQMIFGACEDGIAGLGALIRRIGQRANCRRRQREMPALVHAMPQ